jgi:hypothetical protein
MPVLTSCAESSAVGAGQGTRCPQRTVTGEGSHPTDSRTPRRLHHLTSLTNHEREITVRLTAARVVGVTLAALVLSGCATSAAEPTTTTTPTPSVGDGYLCGGLPIAQEALEERVPVGSIGEAGRIALSTAVWDDGSPLMLPPEEDWYVASITEDQVGVIRDVEVEADPMSGRIAADLRCRLWDGSETPRIFPPVGTARPEAPARSLSTWATGGFPPSS